MCRIWYNEGLTPGESWSDDLALRLKNAECVVVLLTENSVKSKYVQAEINRAVSNDKLIVPVKLDECELPVELKFMLSNLQFVHLYRETEIKRLVALIERLLPTGEWPNKE